MPSCRSRNCKRGTSVYERCRRARADDMAKLLGDQKIVKVAGKAEFHVEVPGKINHQEEQERPAMKPIREGFLAPA